MNVEHLEATHVDGNFRDNLTKLINDTYVVAPSGKVSYSNPAIVDRKETEDKITNRKGQKGISPFASISDVDLAHIP